MILVSGTTHLHCVTKTRPCLCCKRSTEWTAFPTSMQCAVVFAPSKQPSSKILFNVLSWSGPWSITDVLGEATQNADLLGRDLKVVPKSSSHPFWTSSRSRFLAIPMPCTTWMPELCLGTRHCLLSAQVTTPWFCLPLRLVVNVRPTLR